MKAALDTVNVLDLGLSRAARETTRLLAEAGAHVIRAAFAEEDQGGTLAEAYWDRSKEIVTFPAESAHRAADLRKAAALADIIVHDRSAAQLALLGLDPAWLAQHAQLIVCEIGGYPRHHPKGALPVNDVLVLAEAGILDEQQPILRDGPVYLRLPLGTVNASYLAAVGIIARLMLRDRTGQGGHVSTSLLQGAMVPMLMHWSVGETPSENFAKGMPKSTPATLFECSDGLWIHVMGTPAGASLMRAALEAMSPAEMAEANADPQFAHFSYFPDIGAIKQIFRTRPRQEWLDDLNAADVAVQPVLNKGEVFGTEQVAANDYIVPVDDFKHGLLLQPGSPIALDPPLAARPRTRAGSIAWPATPRAKSVPATPLPARPLAGLKVLDLGNYLAGPLAPMILGDLGADVIKLEALTGDAMRGGEWAFGGCQRGKRSIALQLKDPAARPVFERLVRWADVLHHNMRMPAARKLAFDYDSVKAINPAIIYAHVSSYGPKGPSRDWPGYDQLFQAASGWELDCAGQGNRPTWLRFGMMDHCAALASTVGVMLALRRRELTPGAPGSATAASLLGASLVTVDTLRRPDGTMLDRPQLDALQLGTDPAHRLYRTADGWVAVIAASETALAQACGAASPAQIEAQFAGMSAEDAVARLTSAEVSVVKVRENNRSAYLDDPENRSAGLINSFVHPQYGRMFQPGEFVQFPDMERMTTRPQPLIGEHSREILSQLDFTEAEIAEFLRGDVVRAA